MKRELNTTKLREFEAHLLYEERSAATVGKYLHDLRYGKEHHSFL